MKHRPASSPLLLRSSLLVLLGVLLSGGPLAAADVTWTGGGAEPLWSLPGNWSAAVPVNNDNLLFSGTAGQVNTNDLASLTAGSLQFGNGGFDLRGNLMTLNSHITNLAGTNVLRLPLVMASNKRWDVAAGSEVVLAGETRSSGGGQGVIGLVGGGTVRITGSNVWQRGIEITNGTVIVDGGYLNSTNDGFRLRPTDGITVTAIVTNNGTWLMGGGGSFNVGHGGAAATGRSILSIYSGTVGFTNSNNNTTGNFNIGNTPGAWGTVNQFGGTVYANYRVVVGSDSDANATYTMKGGRLGTRDNIIVSNGSNTVAVFNMDGGVVEVGNNLAMGATGSSVSTVTFNHTGGDVGITNDLILPNQANTVSAVYHLNGGSLTLRRIQCAVGAVSGTFNFNGGTLRANPSAHLRTDFIQNIGTVAVKAGGAFIDTDTNTVIVPQALLAPPDAGPSGGLVKLGTGTLILSNSFNTYTGPTEVRAGTLALAGTLGGGNLTVADGARLSLLAATAAQLSAPSITFGGPNGTTLNIDYGTVVGNPSAAALSATTSLTANGPVTIHLAGLGAWAVGQFPIIDYAGTLGGAGFAAFRLGTVPPGVIATLVHDTANTSINLNITILANNLKWAGTSGPNWDINTTANWIDLNTTAATTYKEGAAGGDVVLFDDSAAAATVSITTAVKPVILTVDNASLEYRWEGPGSIYGDGFLTKRSLGRLTVVTSNDFTGGSRLENGVVLAGHNAALGRGPVTLAGAFLASDGATARTLPNPFTVSANATLGDAAAAGALNLAGRVDFANATRTLTTLVPVTLSGGSTNGRFNKLGAGTMTLQGVHHWNGATEVQEGTVILEGVVTNSSAFRPDGGIPGGVARLVLAPGSLAVLTGANNNFRVGFDGDLTATNIEDIAGTMLCTGATAPDGRLYLGGGGTRAIANLLPGGEAIVRAVEKATSTNAVGYTELNFDGGLLRPSTNNAAFCQGLEAAYVRNGGAVIDSDVYDITVAQSMLAGGSGGLRKLGPGLLTLTGTNTYIGPTLVEAGKLILGPAHAAPGAITVSNDATLGFLSTAPGLTVSVPSATVGGGGSAALEARFQGNVGNPTTPAGFINALALNGTVKLNAAAAGLTNGVVPLIRFGTITGTGSIVLGTLPQGITASLATNTAASTIDLVISAVQPLLWVGGTNRVWDVNVSTNWQLGTAGVTYLQGDNVQFDDSAPATQGTVTVAAAMSPSSVVVSNDALAYAFSGAGSIAGSTALVKDGTNTLTVALNNSFTGPVTLKAGAFIAGHSNALGSAAGTTVIGSGATLDGNGLTLNAERVIVSGAGVGGLGALVNRAANQQNMMRDVTLAGETAFGGSFRWDIRGGNGTNGVLSTGGQPHKLRKVDVNQVVLNGVVVDPALGDIDVESGIFQIETTTSLLGDPTKTLTVYSNGIFGFWNYTNQPFDKKIVIQDGGTLRNNSGANAGLSATVVGPVTLTSGTAILNANNAGVTFLIRSGISGDGGFNKLGAGLLILAGTNTHLGATHVVNGTLQLDTTGTLSASTNLQTDAAGTFDLSAPGTFVLPAGRMISGNGTNLGHVTVNGTVSPGAPNALGTLTFSNNLVLAGATALQLDKGLSPSNDVLQVAGALALGGTLNVTNIGAVPLVVGDQFKLLSAASLTGSFASIVPPTPGPGLAWDTNTLATDGVLKVAPGTAVLPPELNDPVLSGGNLILSGVGTPGSTFLVLTSTNVAAPVASWQLATNGIVDATGKFSVTNSVNPAEPERYYQLQLQ